MLTKSIAYDNINKLSMRQQQRTLKTEQYVKPWKFLKNKGFWLSLEVQENIQNKTKTTVITVKISQANFDWNQNFNMRVWSWLRMNAGGVLNTCKSNEAI